jgi:hypothetical protein
MLYRATSGAVGADVAVVEREHAARVHPHWHFAGGRPAAGRPCRRDHPRAPRRDAGPRAAPQSALPVLCLVVRTGARETARRASADLPDARPMPLIVPAGVPPPLWPDRTHVLIVSMTVVRPASWCYPQRCANGHEWGPGLIIVSWTPCDCSPAVAAHGEYSGAGHLTIYCQASPGCRSVWYRPRCERRG